MKASTLLLFGVLISASPAVGTILLNEVHINPPGPADGNYEFVELRSTTNTVESTDGLTIVVIDNNGGSRGDIKEAWSLQGLATGANGLLLLGDDYADIPQGGPWAGSKTAATQVGDPGGMGPDDLGPNDGLTVLLVTGWTGLTNAGVGTLGDADVDDNSVLDWLQIPKPNGSQQTQPWTTLVDSIGYQDSSAHAPYTTVVLPRVGVPSSAPGTVSRLLSNTTANSAAAWYGGTIAGTESDGVAYDLFFGPFKGQATPGQANLNAAPVPPIFLINEVSINPSGPTDSNFEYVEIINTVESNGTKAASLQGYALLIIGSNSGGGGADLGKILEAWNLGSFSTGSNGLLLLGNDYTTGATPWGSYPDPLTHLADPEAPALQNPIRYSSMGDGDIGDNNGFTLLLVQGYTGTIGQDLDTNNDGVLDLLPWTSIKDSIGFDQVVTPPAVGGITYAPAKIAVGYDPDQLSRKLGNVTANTAVAWYGGDYGGNSSISIGLKTGGFFGGFKGEATPGRENLAADAVAGPIRLNEVQLDPIIQPDASYEYVELISSTRGIAGMNGLTLVIADAEADANNGKVFESIDLSGLSTGTNGLMIMGDSYDNISPYNLPAGQIPPQTNREDPQGLDAADDIGPNNGLVLMLVKGPSPAAGTSIADINAADIVDSIGFGSSPNPSVAMVTPSFNPDNLSRLPADFTANSAGSWYGGELDPSGGDASTIYSAQFFGPYKGGASPGRYNHATTPDPTATLLLNEINLNPPGGDNEKEFVELITSSGRATSTNGYSILLIDVDGANTGTVLEEWNLDGMAAGPNGLLLVGNNYTAPGSLPWTGSIAPDPRTGLGFPAGMDFDDIGGATNNGATLVLLVKNFNGRVGDDLDAGNGTTGADDGIFDALPSSQLIDSAGVRFWDAAQTPLPGLVGRVYTGTADLSQTGYTPDTLSRLRENLTPNSAAAWYGGDIFGSAGTSTAYDPLQRFPGAFLGRVTPGVANIPSSSYDAEDPDSDQVTNLLEEALAMDPKVPDANKLPDVGTLDIDGRLHPTMTYIQLKGGPAASLVYTVQLSRELQTWTNGPSETVQVSVTDNPDGLTQTIVVRPATSVLVDDPDPVFLRLRVNRQ